MCWITRRTALLAFCIFVILAEVSPTGQIIKREPVNDNEFSYKDATSVMQRNTIQREAIRRAIEKADRPLSPQEVWDSARYDVPKIGIATVYRTLKGLTDEGVIVPVELPGEAQRYETAGKAHHHHFRCHTCSRVFELKGCAGSLGHLLPPGFTMDGHEIYLYGHCQECLAPAAKRPRKRTA